MVGNPVRCVNDWNGEDHKSTVKFPFCHFEKVPETGWFLRSGGCEIAPWTRTQNAAMISLWDLNLQGKIWQTDRWGPKESFCYKWNATKDRSVEEKYRGVVEQCVCRSDECNKKQMANYNSDPPKKFVKCHHTAKTPLPLEPSNPSNPSDPSNPSNPSNTPLEPNSNPEVCLGNYCVYRREITVFKSNLPMEEFRTCLNVTEKLPIENFLTDDGQFVWVFCNDGDFCNNQNAVKNYKRIDEIVIF